MKLGDIIYFNNLVFKDGKKDIKYNRPCIYLFEENIDGKDFVFSIPITSRIVRFNNVKNDSLILIPETIYNYRKLSFAKIDGIISTQKNEMIGTEITLANETINNILTKTIEITDDIELRKKLIELKNNLSICNEYPSPVRVKRMFKKVSK